MLTNRKTKILFTDDNERIMFKLTEDQKDIIELVTKFCEKEVKPLAAIIDEENRFPHETVQKMVISGWMGVK